MESKLTDLEIAIKLEEIKREEWQQECLFVPNQNMTSATICANCGNEKFLHTKQETLEEAAENKFGKVNPTLGKSNYRMGYESGLIAGAKWQQEKMYSDMQEYAEFCIECDRKEMPLLLVQDWYEHYKN
jgi:hypothetical protein